MKIVVTGSEGYIGSHLVPFLKIKGHEVSSIDKKLGSNILTTQLSDVDVIVHLSAQTSVFNNDINLIEEDNIRAFIKVVEDANRLNARLIYASSSCAFNITSMYGLSKMFDEEYAQIYAHNALGLRFHNVYSLDARDGTLFAEINKAILTKEKLVLYNGGNNIRHFTYIDDVIKGIYDAILCNEVGIVNISNPQVCSVNEVVKEVQKYQELLTINASTREFDKLEQKVDDKVKTLQLNYIPIQEGVKLIYGRNGIRLG